MNIVVLIISICLIVLLFIFWISEKISTKIAIIIDIPLVFLSLYSVACTTQKSPKCRLFIDFPAGGTIFCSSFLLGFIILLLFSLRSKYSPLEPRQKESVIFGVSNFILLIVIGTIGKVVL